MEIRRSEMAELGWHAIESPVQSAEEGVLWWKRTSTAFSILHTPSGRMKELEVPSRLRAAHPDTPRANAVWAQDLAQDEEIAWKGGSQK